MQPASDTPSPRGSTRRVALLSGRVLIALLSAATLVVAGLGYLTVRRVNASVGTTSVLSDLSTAPGAPPVEDGATDVLLVGSDSRTDAQGNPLPANVLRQLRTEASDGVNTDTIIVLRIPHDGSRAHAISIPRDTYLPIPGYRDDKINAAYGATKYRTAQDLQQRGGLSPADLEKKSDQAGRAALVQTVQNLTGLRVDHYAEINLYGFYLLTEAVGGVEVCLNHATSDPDSGANFRAGPQTVQGGDALSFVRQRKNLPNGDLDRIVRQQVFMASAVRQLLSAGTLTDPGRLGKLLDAARKSLVIDEGWDLTGFLTQAQGLAAGNVDFATIPVLNPNATNDRGQSIVQVDRDQVRAFVASLVHAPTPSPSSSVTPSVGPSPSVAPSSSSVAPSSGHGVAGPAALHLDGPARAADPVTVDGTRCVD